MEKKSIFKRLLAVLLVLAMLLTNILISSVPGNTKNAAESITVSRDYADELLSSQPEKEETIKNVTDGEPMQPSPEAGQNASKDDSISDNEPGRSSSFSPGVGENKPGNDASEESETGDEAPAGDMDEESAGTEGNTNIDLPLSDTNTYVSQSEDKKGTENSRLIKEEEDEKLSEALLESRPKDEQIVEFMVVLDKAPLLAVFSSKEISQNTSEVAAYRSEQEQRIAEVEAALNAAFGAQEGFSLGYDHILTTTSVSVRTRYANKAAIEQMEGVEKVYISPDFKISTAVDETDSGIYTNNAPSMIGATQLNGTGYTGKGMTIAIIDTGIVVEHPSFQEMSPDKLTEDSLTEDFVDGIWGYLNAGRSTTLRNAAYHSNKLPFIFNYHGRDFDVSHRTASHDHGTHVAGIAAANKMDTTDVMGIAPDAQIVVMQVFNPSGGANWSTILAALEDCVALGVDTVNLSLGSPAGFTDGDLEMKAVLDMFDHTDTNVIIAGGNDTNNAYMNLTGTNMSKTKDIDNSLISTPATASRALAVASADNDGADLPFFTVGSTKIGFSDSAVSAHTNFLSRFKGQELEFVVIDGTGDIGDYADKNVKDKVAVVSRGSISFQDKQKNAKEMGAKALVVYNNVPGSFSMAISDGDGHIPCIAISRSAGEKLKAMSAGTLTVCQQGELTHVSVDCSMSSFSSWGITPDLKLKPEITGVGGNIYSTRDPAIGGSNYGNMSGTSMASPQIAGAVTILSEYLRTTYNNKYQGKDLRILATNLLMSTASQLREGETVYSPRYQGAGLVDLTKATTAGAYLSSTSAYENRPKAEMGDNDTREGSFSFRFMITNITDEQKTYTFDSTVLTPDVDSTGSFMTNSTRALEAKVSVKQGAEQKTSVVVPANGSVELSAQITLTGNDKNFINNHFVNGTYVEGYLFAKESKEGGVDLSMPFLGFFGDWSDAPVFDGAGEEASLYSPSIKTRKSRLGHNPYITGGKAGDKYNAIADTNPLEGMTFGMMRNSKKVTQSVTSRDGNTQYFMLDEKNVAKTYYSASYGMIIPYNLINYSEQVYIWDGTNNGEPLPDNTTATYTISSYLDDGDDKVDDTYSFDVTIDNTSPVIENAEKLGETAIKNTTTGRVKLPLAIKENHYVAAVIFESIEGTILGKFQVDNVPGEVLRQEFDVTGYGADFTVIVADYACNETEVEVSLDLSDMPMLQLEPKELDKGRIYGNETYSDGYVSMGWFSANKTDFSDLRNETFDAENRTYSGEYINGYVIAQRSSDGALLLLTPYDTYWNTKVIWTQESKSIGGEGLIVLYDIAMNYAADKLYAIGWVYGGDKDGNSKDDGHNALFEIKLGETVAVEEVAQIQDLGEGVDALTLGCTTEGQLYTISTKGILYKLSAAGAVEEVGTTDFVEVPNYSGVNVIQSMCYDHEAGEMYWYAHSQTRHAGSYINVGGMYKVNLTDASLTRVGASGSSGYTSLFIPTDLRSESIQFRVESTGIEISPSEVKMAKGQSRRMSVEWKPWNALPGTIKWGSENTGIVTVSNNGVIKAIATGETNVTATATIGGQEKTYKVKVTVIPSTDSIYGFSIRDYNGKHPDFSWITYSDSDLKSVTKIGSSSEGIQGGAYYKGNVYFVIAEKGAFGAGVSTRFYKSSVAQGKTPGETTLGSPVLINTIEGIEVGNLAFDYTSGRMYGVDYTNGGLCLLDIETGNIDLLGSFTGDLSAAIMPAMCVTAKGNVIGSDMSGNLYHVDPDNMNATKIGSIGEDSWYYAGMTYDYNTGHIYWNPCMGEGRSDFYVVMIDDAQVKAYTTEIIHLGGVSGDEGMEQTVLFTIPAVEPKTTYIQATAIQITNGEELVGLEGSTMQLTTQTEPARPSISAREWFSDNDAVASVDQFGKVTFKKAGTATITVTVRNRGENPNPESCSDTVKVTVTPAAGEFVAFLAADEYATSYYDFWIKMKDYDLQHSEVGTSMIGTYSLRTGEYYDGYFYAYNNANVLYCINEKNYGDYVSLGTNDLGADNRVISMAFDYTEGIMYGVTLYKDSGGTGKLVKINLNNGKVTEVAALTENISAIAADGSGKLYGVGSKAMYQTTYLYEIDKKQGTCTQMKAIEASGGVDWTGDNYMSEQMFGSQMTYDYGTDRLYLNATIRHKTMASSGYGIYMIQLKGEGQERTVDYIANMGKPALNLKGNQKVGDMYLGLFCSVPEPDEIVLDKVTGLRMNRESARVTVNGTTQLRVTVSPSGAKDKTVTWSSDNQEIATVDPGSGLVTGVKVGTTTIKATSNKDSAIVASCKLTVLEQTGGQTAATAYTISAAREALVSFNPELPADTAKEMATLSGGGNIVGMDMKDEKNIYYLVEDGSGPWPHLFVYNLDTKQSVSRGYLEVFIGGASDIAYDPVNKLLYVVSGFYVFQFEESKLQAGAEMVNYASYLDTTKANMPLSHMHAITCKEGRIYFIGSDGTAALYRMTDKFKDLTMVRRIEVNTVAGKCELAYDANTGLFYLTDAGDRLYSFKENGEGVTAIDLLGDGWDINGLAIQAGEAATTEKPAESSDAANTKKPEESPDTANTEEAAESPDTANTEESAESPDTANTEESEESPDTANTEELAESSDTANMEEAAESSEPATNTGGAAESSEPANTGEAADIPETTSTEEGEF